MKRLLSGLLRSTLVTSDGPVGIVKDFYFDDLNWRIRYALVSLPGRGKVLVPSSAFLPREWDLATLPVALSLNEVKACPPSDSDRPVSQQKMNEVLAMVPWPEAGMIGAPGIDFGRSLGHSSGDPHLRSFSVVRRYLVDSSRGMVGRVVDFAVDDQSWAIHGLVVKTGFWGRRRTVLASLSWANAINWAQGTIWTEAHPADWHSAPTLGWQTARARLA